MIIKIELEIDTKSDAEEIDDILEALTALKQYISNAQEDNDDHRNH